MEAGLLVINAGSSSIKFAGYADHGEAELVFLGKGQVEAFGTEPRFVCRNAAGAVLGEHRWPGPLTHGEAIDHIIGWIEDHGRTVRIAAAGHRVVFGGTSCTGPRRLDERAITEIEQSSRFSPCTFLTTSRRSGLSPSGIRNCRR